MKPPAPEPAQVTAAGPKTLRIVWDIPDADPEVTACTVKVRIQGSSRWQNYDHSAGLLVTKGGATVPAQTSEITVGNIEEGLFYEAVVAAMNSDGWGEISQPSKPACVGEAKTRTKPPRPMPAKLTPIGPGKMRCSWEVPEACPPVEASQLQLSELTGARKRTFLVDATNGKLVQSGRTTFAVPRNEATINGIEDSIEYVVAVCCRSAEGFGEYSNASDSSIFVDTSLTQEHSCMQLVLHSGPSEGDAPVLEPFAAGEGKMKIRWVLPDEAKSTTVKMRRVGDTNWYLCGGATIAAPASETVAVGLEEGIDYEVMVAFQIGGRWCGDSPISRPTCIGEKLLPAVPVQPPEPKLTVMDQSRMRLRWKNVTAVPGASGAQLRMRQLGSRVWFNVHPTTGQLSHESVDEPAELVPAPASEVVVNDLQPGIRYEASVALKNKLGLGPFSSSSDIACIGRPAQNLHRCTLCFCDYDIQHAEYDKDPDAFWCPVCRFRQMDPFNAVIEPYGMLLCHCVARPSVTFSIDLTDLKSWRKEENSIFFRMVKINSDSTTQVWPRRVSIEANGHEVGLIKEPEEGHVRRDVPMNITAHLKPGVNAMRIVIEDEMASSFALSLVRTQGKTAETLAADILVDSSESASERVALLLAPNWKTNAKVELGPQPEHADAEKKVDEGAHDVDEDDITCVISNKLRLRCPLSFERVEIPVRGEQCMHLQCFGLGAYLESNSKMRAMNNRWTCPVCSTVLRPQDLRIDGFVKKVLDETPAHIEEVEILEDGSYRIIEEAGDQPAASPRNDAADAEGGDADEDMDDGPVVEAVTLGVGGAEEKNALRKRKEPVAKQDESLAMKRQRRRQEIRAQNVENAENNVQEQPKTA
jgi:hypothetical protein